MGNILTSLRTRFAGSLLHSNGDGIAPSLRPARKFANCKIDYGVLRAVTLANFDRVL